MVVPKSRRGSGVRAIDLELGHTYEVSEQTWVEIKNARRAFAQDRGEWYLVTLNTSLEARINALTELFMCKGFEILVVQKVKNLHLTALSRVVNQAFFYRRPNDICSSVRQLYARLKLLNFVQLNWRGVIYTIVQWLFHVRVLTTKQLDDVLSRSIGSIRALTSVINRVIAPGWMHAGVRVFATAEEWPRTSLSGKLVVDASGTATDIGNQIVSRVGTSKWLMRGDDNNHSYMHALVIQLELCPEQHVRAIKCVGGGLQWHIKAMQAHTKASRLVEMYTAGRVTADYVTDSLGPKFTVSELCTVSRLISLRASA
jgi:hypothetical protein